MDLSNKTLDIWLKDAPESEYKFGQHIDFYRKYLNLREYCDKNIYPHISLGANLKDRTVFLNDHGIEHIKTVLRRASELVLASKCKLTPKEVFYLICAILLHDIGNILGRYEHELNISTVIKEAGDLFSDDTSEQRLIRDIARVHGGKTDSGDKDTINLLTPVVNMDSEEIRVHLIASILRFADELADDKNRGAAWPIKKGLVPDESKIYHEYSLSLNSVVISHDERELCLNFYLQTDKLKTQFIKDGKSTYLIDEIYSRLLKLHTERIYCLRFMKEYIELDKILVNIEFVSKYFEEMSKIKPLKFTLAEFGYPEIKEDSIFKLCPSLREGGTKFDGKYFANLI